MVLAGTVLEGVSLTQVCPMSREHLHECFSSSDIKKKLISIFSNNFVLNLAVLVHNVLYSGALLLKTTFGTPLMHPSRRSAVGEIIPDRTRCVPWCDINFNFRREIHLFVLFAIIPAFNILKAVLVYTPLEHLQAEPEYIPDLELVERESGWRMNDWLAVDRRLQAGQFFTLFF